ncbi:MAG: arsinothricin resistance N-acetyltransferase ArsN1 family B [Nocardioidaceae bacterium]
MASPEGRIRAATPTDAEAIRALYAPIVAETVASFEVSPPDADEIGRRISARPRLPWLVAEVAGAVVGFSYCSPHRQRHAYRWSADCSAYVGSGHQRQGLGRLLYQRLFSEMRGLGYVSVFAGIALPNAPSVALHEAVGFEPVGVFRNVGYKHGSWHDVGWWQRSLVDPPNAPAEPREWPGDARDQ